MDSYSNSYKEAGVDVTMGYKAVELIKSHVRRTRTEGVVDEIGGFGGTFRPDLTGLKEPVLVSGTDGVGTKLKIAFMLDKHDTVGIDCVAMCANDVACSGAKPLFMLDYISIDKNIPEKVESIVSGVADGCVQAGCALIGGETAEMPGIYSAGEYDLAGFCVGLADRQSLINGADIRVGDALIGIESSGVHSNGFSLVRKAFGVSAEKLAVYSEELGKTLGEELITPTKIYVKTIGALTDAVKVKGLSHITGGGFYENIPRMFSSTLRARIDKASVPVKPVFDLLRATGIPERDMFNTFNMGVGMIVSVAPEDADAAIASLTASGEKAYVLGELVESSEGVIIEG